jgi:hypothetical protein
MDWIDYNRAVRHSIHLQNHAMKTLIQRLKSIPFTEKSVPWALLVVSFVAYGILIPWLGFYGDDWSYIWLLKTGSMQPFFEHNRAILAPIYEGISKILGLTPWPWHVFILLVHWACACAFWQLLRLLWPSHARTHAAAALLFVLYPSFLVQSGAVTFWLVFAQFTLFLLSFVWGIRALQSDQKTRWIYLFAALAAETLNLVISEYFFFLELLRPVLYAIASAQDGIPLRKRLKKISLFCLPSLAIFVADILWRMTHQAQITGFYKLSLLSELSQSPLGTLWMLIREFGNDLRISLLYTWSHAAFPVELKGVSLPILLAYAAGVIFCAAAVYIYQQKLPEDQTKPGRRFSVVLILLGLLILVLAGGPFRMAGISIDVDYSTSRFSIPHIFGNCLLLAGLILLLPQNKIHTALWSVFIALAIGLQFLVGNVYRMDWNTQRSLYWQITERMPDLQKDTVLVVAEDPVMSSEENALSGALNYIYSQTPTTYKVDYYLYFIPDRVMNDFGSLETGRKITGYHLIGTFNGTTSQVVGVNIDASHCLRVLDPGLDSQNNKLNDLLKGIAPLSTTRPILTGGNARRVRLPAGVFGSDPTPAWCTNFQKADLYRQLGDWNQAAAQGDQITSYEPFSVDPVKLFTYVEAYAHTGHWKKADRMMKFVAGRSANMDKLTCTFVQRVDNSTSESAEKKPAVAGWKNIAKCP